MANKAIEQYNETSTTQDGDFLLLSRNGNGYFSIDPVNLRLGVQVATLTILKAEIEALNTTPQTIVAAQGAGSYIQAEGMTVVRFAGSAYGTNDDIRCKFNGEAEADYYFEVDGILGATAETVEGGIRNSTGVSMQENTDLEIFVPSGDPTSAGTGSILVYVWYRVIFSA